MTKEFGHVAMIPVGLDTIGSVIFEDKFKRVASPGTVQVSKGEKLGHFAYGGSTVITLIEQGHQIHHHPAGATNRCLPVEGPCKVIKLMIPVNVTAVISRMPPKIYPSGKRIAPLGKGSLRKRY